MKSTESKRKISGQATPSVIMERAPSASDEDRRNYIATAAYYKSEARGFEPGQEINDWLEAEAKFD